MLNLEKKIRQEVANRGITFKFLAGQIEVTEAGLSKMLKNNSMKVDTLEKISDVLGLNPCFWFQEGGTMETQTAIGTGNIAGDSNKQRVQIGKDDCPQRLEALQEKYALLEKAVADKEMIIELLRGQRQG